MALRRNALLIDAATAALIALFVRILIPGLAVLGVLALLVIASLALIVRIRRRGHRRRPRAVAGRRPSAAARHR